MTDPIENVRRVVNEYADRDISAPPSALGLREMSATLRRELAWVEKCVGAHERLVHQLRLLVEASPVNQHHREADALSLLAELEAAE